MVKVVDKESKDFSERSRLENIIDESFEYEDNFEDVGQFLRENGIEIN
jgi:hypothetical protein